MTGVNTQNVNPATNSILSNVISLVGPVRLIKRISRVLSHHSDETEFVGRHGRGI